MKIKIKKEVEEEVDVDLPRYYVHDVGGDTYDSVIYGRIDLNWHVSVQRNHSYTQGSRSWEFEREPSDFSSCSCYFKKGYTSTKEEFYGAFSRGLEFTQDLERS